MQPGLVSVTMNWSDIFTAPAPLYVILVAVVRIPVTVQLMETGAAALPTFSWRHEYRSAALSTATGASTGWGNLGGGVTQLRRRRTARKTIHAR